MSELAIRLDMSARQLQRRFRSCSGLTPKQYARARRLRAIAADLGRNERRPAEASWVARAIDLGFADQAHLTRELSAMTGRSPVSFATDIGAIAHGEVLP